MDTSPVDSEPVVEHEPPPISTYAADSIASFAAKIERVADDQQSLWYEQ